MISFNEFLELNEELNYKITNDLIEFEDRWFYYDTEDEIVYGCNEPNKDGLFSFNPGSCEVIYKGEKIKYDINNPICIITLKMDKTNEFAIYTENAVDFLSKSYRYEGFDIKNDREILQNSIETDEEYRVLIMYGKELVASTFDIIEEN